MTSTAGPLLLLDGASMWFRSYFGVPSSITAPDGRPVNALRGFLDAVATLITRERPHRLVVCRDDDWRPQWRVEKIPSYKAHRVAQESTGEEPDAEEVPDELTPQVDMIFEILDAFGIATAGAAHCEADDVLGTLAERERRDPVVVVSGDRDLLQLVRDEPVPVRVLYLGRGLAKASAYGPEEVAENTIACFKRTIPAAVPGIMFLSGGQSDDEATTNLDAINRHAASVGAPWELSFSYGRGLQAAPLKAWSGRPANRELAQSAFHHRAYVTGAARRGAYEPEMEKAPALS